MKLPPKKELLIGGGVVGGALVIYLYTRPKIAKATAATPTDTVDSSVPQTAQASPFVNGGSSGMDYSTLYGSSQTPTATSPVPGDSSALALGLGAGTVPTDPTPAPDASPTPVVTAAPPVAVNNFGLPSGYVAGFPFGQKPPNLGMLIGTVLGYKNMGGGSNGNGSYTTFRFYSNLGNTEDWNYYYSGAKNGSWVGPFSPRFGVGAGG